MATGDLFVGVGSGSGSQSPGGIVGDLPNPFNCAVLSATQYLTTGDLQAYQSPDFGTLTGFTVEFWFAADTVTPAGGNKIMAGPESATGTGLRQWQFTLNADGTVTFWVRNSTPAQFSVTSVAPISGSRTWYHIVGVLDGVGGNLLLYINGSLSATTAGWTGSVQGSGMFAGTDDFFVGDPVGSINNTYYDEVAVYRVPLAADRILAHYQAGAQRGFRHQLPGIRVIAALDAISSHAPRRIGAGTRTMQPKFTTGDSALDVMQLARQAENVDATLFVSKSGEVVFLDAAHRSSGPYNTVQMTLGDAGGTEIPYEDLSVDYSESTLANEWNVTRASPTATTQTVSDSTSIASYFRRPQSITDLPLESDTDSLAIANGMLAKYKDPILRGTSVSLDAGDPSVAEVAFDRDLADRINVKRTPPGGGARISQDLFVQQIQISGANDGKPWSVQWGLSPL